MVVFISHRWRAETLQSVLEFDNFKPCLKNDIFKCISCWLNNSGFFFFGTTIGFSERVSQDQPSDTKLKWMSPLNLPPFSSVLIHICSPWLESRHTKYCACLTGSFSSNVFHLVKNSSTIYSVRMMTDMGFTRAQADRAMRLAFNNPDR